MLWYIITPVVMAIVILLLIKVFGGKYSTTTEEVHRKPPKQLEYTWDGVFGVLFFIGASIMGASFPIRALMLLVAPSRVAVLSVTRTKRIDIEFSEVFLLASVVPETGLGASGGDARLRLPPRVRIMDAGIQILGHGGPLRLRRRPPESWH